MKNGVYGNGCSSETTSDKKELFRGFLSYICTQLLRPFRSQNSKIRFLMNLRLRDHSAIIKIIYKVVCQGMEGSSKFDGLVKFDQCI